MTPPPPRLFCFHHAGAGVSCFAHWQARIGAAAEVVPVPLPGRETRAREPRITGPDQLTADLAARIGPLLDRPYLLYGHSLGGLVVHAFALAREAAGLAPPELVVLGAALPPHLRSPLLAGLALPDAELLDLLVGLGALPTGVGLDEGLWRRFVLPLLRDDLRLAEALTRAAGGPGPAPPLGARLLALAGRRDPIAPADQMAQWSRHAPDFELRTVPGDHFFVRDDVVPELLRELAGGLRPVLRREASTA